MHNFNIKRYVASFKAVVGIFQFTAWLAIQKDELFRNDYVPALPKKCILRSISSYTLTPRAHRLIQSLILSLSISLCPPHQHRGPHLEVILTYVFDKGTAAALSNKLIELHLLEAALAQLG